MALYLQSICKTILITLRYSIISLFPPFATISGKNEHVEAIQFQTIGLPEKKKSWVFVLKIICKVVVGQKCHRVRFLHTSHFGRPLQEFWRRHNNHFWRVWKKRGQSRVENALSLSTSPLKREKRDQLKMSKFQIVFTDFVGRVKAFEKYLKKYIFPRFMTLVKL